MSSQILIVARHELRVTFATRRALAAVLLYWVSAVLGAVGYVSAIRAVERQAAQTLTRAGMDPVGATRTVSRHVPGAYQEFIRFFADTERGIAESLTHSLILPAFLWGSLAFLPFLVVLTSFDALASDLQTRSLCYSTLRAPRRALLFGKLSAHAVLFACLSMLASLAMIAVAAVLLDGFDVLGTLPGLLRTWLLLLPYGLAYLGLSLFCSATVKQPTVSLILALGLMVALRLLGVLRHAPDPFAWLRAASWLSPARYQGGLWEAGAEGPITSSLAYLTLGATFVFLAQRQLRVRDL